MLSGRSLCENVTYSMIPTLWHSGKGYGNSTKASGWWELEGKEGSTGVEWRILGHWKYFAWYFHGSHVSLYICPKPQNARASQVALVVRNLPQRVRHDWAHIECAAPRMWPMVNYGLWVIKMCLWWIFSYQWTIGGGCWCWGSLWGGGETGCLL